MDPRCRHHSLRSLRLMTTALLTSLPCSCCSSVVPCVLLLFSNERREGQLCASQAKGRGMIGADDHERTRWLLRQRRGSSATRRQSSASRRKFSPHRSHYSHYSQSSPPRTQEVGIQGAPSKGSLKRFSHSSKDCDTPLDSKSKCASRVLPFEERRGNR